MICADPEAALARGEKYKSIFLPSGSNEDVLANDCVPKAINQALGFLFFSRREQLLRLIGLNDSIGCKRAGKIKSRGGIPIKVLKQDFAILEKQAYSLRLLDTFVFGKDEDGGTKVFDFIVQHMYPGSNFEREGDHLFKELIIVARGHANIEFKHAFSVIRRDHQVKKGRWLPQLLLLENKNSMPVPYP